jgi:hypothetical protein
MGPLAIYRGLSQGEGASAQTHQYTIPPGCSYVKGGGGMHKCTGVGGLQRSKETIGRGERGGGDQRSKGGIVALKREELTGTGGRRGTRSVVQCRAAWGEVGAVVKLRTEGGRSSSSRPCGSVALVQCVL